LLNARSDQFIDFGLDNGRPPAINQVDLCLDWIDTNDFMPVIRQASGRHCADVPQTKYADSQDAFLSPKIIGRSDFMSITGTLANQEETADQHFFLLTDL